LMDGWVLKNPWLWIGQCLLGFQVVKTNLGIPAPLWLHSVCASCVGKYGQRASNLLLICPRSCNLQSCMYCFQRQFVTQTSRYVRDWQN
jgi:hypothetical protein